MFLHFVAFLHTRQQKTYQGPQKWTLVGSMTLQFTQHGPLLNLIIFHLFQAVHSFSGPLSIMEDLFGPCGTKLVYKEPSLTFMVQKRNPQMDLLWTIESTKYQRL